MKIRLAISFGIFAVIVAAILFVANQSKTDATSGTIQANNAKSIKPTTAKNEGTPKLTADENKLKEKYNARFQEVNTLADKRLDSLLEQAQKEVTYKTKNHLDTHTIPQKYLAVFNSYEQQATTNFDTLYKQLEIEAAKSKQTLRFGQAFQTDFQIGKASRMLKFQKKLQTLTQP